MSGLRSGGGNYDFIPEATPFGTGGRPPKVWASVVVEDEDVVVALGGWRAALAMKRRLRIPLARVLRVEHDAQPRLHVRAKLRKRAGQTGMFRLGSYHSLDGWSFWAIGLGRNAVVIETTGAPYRFVVVEVEEPYETVAAIRKAVGLVS